MWSSAYIFIFCLLRSYCSQVPTANKKFITQEVLPSGVPECLDLLEKSLVEHQFLSYLVTKDTTAEGVKKSKKLWIDSWIAIRHARKRWELGSCHICFVIKSLGQIINEFHLQLFGVWDATKALSQSSSYDLLKTKESYADLKDTYSSKLPVFEKLSTTGLNSAQSSGWIASVIRVQLVLLDLILADFDEPDSNKKWEKIGDQMNVYNFTLNSISSVAKLLLSCGPRDLHLNEIYDELTSDIDLVVLSLQKRLRLSHLNFPDWALFNNVPIFLVSSSVIFESGLDEFEMILLARRRAIMALGRLYKNRKNQLTAKSASIVCERFRNDSDDISFSFEFFYFTYFLTCFKTPEEQVQRILRGVQDCLKKVKSKCVSLAPDGYVGYFADLCYIEKVIGRLESDQLSKKPSRSQTYTFIEKRIRSVVSSLDSLGIENGNKNLSLYLISDAKSIPGLSVVCSSQAISQYQRFAQRQEELGDLLIDLYDVLIWVQGTLAEFNKDSYKINHDTDYFKYEIEFREYTEFALKSVAPLEDIAQATLIIFEIHRGTWPEKVPKSFQDFFLQYYTTFKLHNFAELKKMISAQPNLQKKLLSENSEKKVGDNEKEIAKVESPEVAPQTGRSRKNQRAKVTNGPQASKEDNHAPAIDTALPSTIMTDTDDGLGRSTSPTPKVTSSSSTEKGGLKSRNSPTTVTASIGRCDTENVGIRSCSSTLTAVSSTTSGKVELETPLVSSVSLIHGDSYKNDATETENIPASLKDEDPAEIVQLGKSEINHSKTLKLEASPEEEALTDEVPCEQLAALGTEPVVCSSEGTASEGKEEEQEVEHDQDEGEETDSTTTSDPDTSQLFHILTCIDFEDLENAGDAVDPRDIAMAYILIGEKIYKDYLKEFITLTKCKPTLYKSQDAFEACIRTHYIMQNAEFMAAMERTGIPNMAYLWKSIRFYRKRNQFVNQATPMFKRFRNKIIKMNLEILNVYAKEQAAGDIELPTMNLAPILASYKERLANRLKFTGSTCYPIQKDGRPDTFLTPELTEITLAVLSLHRFVTYGKKKGQTKSLLPQTVFECRHNLAHMDFGEQVLGPYVTHIFRHSPDFDFLTWLINFNYQ